MIKEITKTPPNKYGKFFLSVEAPSDESDEAPAIHKNTKVITVKPNNRNRTDFGAGLEEFEDDPEPDVTEEPSESDDTVTEEIPQEDPTNAEPTISIDGEEVQPDDTAELPDTSDDFGAGTKDDGEEVQPDDVTEEPSESDATVTEEIPHEENPDDPSPDMSDDFGTGTEDQGEQPDQAQTNEQPAEGERKGPGLEYDSTRKYNLFKEFMSLSNAIDNYISKLENNISDDMTRNQIIKTATAKLREIRDLCYDYMVMKFEISTYVQSLLFYQNLIVLVQMVFNLLSKMKKKTKK